MNTILTRKQQRNLLRYLADQEIATSVVPDDRTIVIERVRDELGDWRVCVLTAVRLTRTRAVGNGGGRGAFERAGGPDVEVMWGRTMDSCCGSRTLTPRPMLTCFCWMLRKRTGHVLRQLGATALFAAKFRESAARALLLPRKTRHRPGAIVAAA